MALSSPLLTGEMASKGWVPHALNFWYTSMVQTSLWISGHIYPISNLKRTKEERMVCLR